MVELVNLTDHEVNIAITDTRIIRIPPSGEVLRAEYAPIEHSYILYRGDVIPLVRDGVVISVDPPPEQEGILYITSHAVARYCSEILGRRDIICPATMKKDRPLRIGEQILAVRKLRLN
jgi:hypothetical protein